MRISAEPTSPHYHPRAYKITSVTHFGKELPLGSVVEVDTTGGWARVFDLGPNGQFQFVGNDVKLKKIYGRFVVHFDETEE